LPSARQALIAGGFFIAFQLLGEVVYPGLLKNNATFQAMNPTWKMWVGTAVHTRAHTRSCRK
jgi:hypothetical protein